MIFHRLKSINNQRGFTLIELVIAIAITGLVTGGITMTIFQVFDLNTRTSNHMIAVRQVQSAGYWVSHDTQMAQNVNTVGASGFPLTLTWTDWDSGDVYEVVYTLEDMTTSTLKNLQRIHSINGTTTETGYVAQYIDSTNTSCVWDDVAGKLTLTVTATVGTGSQQSSETRIYEVIPRPGS